MKHFRLFNKKDTLIIFACFCGIGICYGFQYSFSIFFVEITKFFNVTKASGAFVFSLTLLVYGLYAPFIGILTNKFGGRKIFRVASLILISGVILSAFARNIFQLYFTLGIITAIGMNSVGFVPITIIISNNFKEKKGLALGLATTGVGVGAIAMSILTKILIDIFDWQIALVSLGVLSSLLIVFCSGFLPTVPRGSSFKLDFYFLKTKDFWLIQGGMAFGAMTVQSVMLHIVAFFIEKGVTVSLSAITISLIALTGSVGKISWGFLSDGFKPIVLYIVACFLIMLSILILSADFFNPVVEVFIFSILFGIGYGSFAPLFPHLFLKSSEMILEMLWGCSLPETE